MTNITPDAVNPPPWEMTNENEKITEKWISTQLTSHCICSTLLQRCKGVEPFNDDYLICPLCESTFILAIE